MIYNATTVLVMWAMSHVFKYLKGGTQKKDIFLKPF